MQKPDSLAKNGTDPTIMAGAADSLKKLVVDSLLLGKDSLQTALPDSLRYTLPADSTAILPTATDSLSKDSVVLTEKQLKRQQRRENREPFLSDSMALRKVC